MFSISLRKSFCNICQNLLGTALFEDILAGSTWRRGASSTRWRKRPFLGGCTSATSMAIPQQHLWVYLNNVCSYALKLPVGASKPCSGKSSSFSQVGKGLSTGWLASEMDSTPPVLPGWMRYRNLCSHLMTRLTISGAGVGGGGSSLPVRKLLKRITRSV